MRMKPRAASSPWRPALLDDAPTTATRERPPLLLADCPAVSPAAVVSAARELCACGHPADDHDPVGRRYCTATEARGWERGCICRPRTSQQPTSRM